jgi:membrane-associated phospholipid phosphatase
MIFDILFIFFISFYHYIILNPLEKNIFRHLFYNDKRPKIDCKNDESFRCYGMPSGHTETIVIFCLLLFHKKYISKFIVFLLVLLIISQRLLSKMHTFKQVFVGLIMGSIYSAIYIQLNNKLYIILFILFITLLYKSIFSRFEK